MTTLEFEDLPLSLARHLVDHPDDPIDIVLNGESIGSLRFVAEEDEEAIDLSRAPRLKEILDAAREDYKRRGGVSAAEVRRMILGESQAG
jgi:hypothetical protein